MIFYRSFYTKHKRARSRTGPDDKNVINVLVGNLVGDYWSEHRNGLTHFQINQCNDHAEYLYWLHQFYSKKYYCFPERPKLRQRKSDELNNKVSFYLRFNTSSFSSLNWLENAFYRELIIKRVPFLFFPKTKVFGPFQNS